MSNESTILNCSQRFTLGEVNVDPVPIQDRYLSDMFLQNFLPGTLLVVRIFMLTWLTVGLFGNSLSFAIWVTKHQRRKSTSAVYLSALALADLILILTLVNYHVERYWGLSSVTTVPGLCQIYQCLTMFAQYYSTTLVFGFTLERYLAVCFPFKRHKFCSGKRAVIAVVILALICTVPMLFQAVLWTFEDGVCHMKYEWVQDRTVQGVLTGQEIIFSIVVPLAALVFNLLLLKEMRRLIRSTAIPTPSGTSQRNGSNAFRQMLKYRKSSSYSMHSTYSSPDPSQNDEARSRESSNFVTTTVMLVILSFYLIFCAVPPGVVYLAQFTWVQPDDCLTDEAVYTDSQWTQFLSQLQAKELIDVLCASHYALNFFIYILTSKGFRQHALWILSCNIEKLKSLSKPTVEAWLFPRRTGPRHPRMSTTEERQTLVPDTNSDWHRKSQSDQTRTQLSL